MHTKIPPKLLTFLSLLCGSNIAVANPEHINDAKFLWELSRKAGALAEAGKTLTASKMQQQLLRKNTKLILPPQRDKPLENIYKECVESIAVITPVHWFEEQRYWLSAGAATAWVLHSDGVLVTNYHVLDKKENSNFGVMMRDGKCNPISEILAANKEKDIAGFKIEAKGLKPLPLRKLNNPQKVGGKIHIISHPDSKYFTYTNGYVSRYATPIYEKVPWISVTAEFAIGSSGAPILDNAGNVCGVVATTQAIYSKKGKGEKTGALQMSIRNCVPLEAIYELIDQSSPNESQQK